MRNVHGHMFIIYSLLLLLLSSIIIHTQPVSAKRSKGLHKPTGTTRTSSKRSGTGSSAKNEIKAKKRNKDKGKVKDDKDDDESPLVEKIQEKEKRKRIVGTQITGAGHHNRRNRSIFDKAHESSTHTNTNTGTSTNANANANANTNTGMNTGTGPLSAIMRDRYKSQISNSIDNPVKGRMYTKRRPDGTLLFHVPHSYSHQQDKDKIISLSTKLSDKSQSNADADPVILANYMDVSDKDGDADGNEGEKVDLTKEWIPIEGIYGIYMLPSGPHLVLITDSEEIYKINEPGQKSGSKSGSGPGKQSKSLINLRRVLSMEIVRIPSTNGRKRHRHSEERRQFGVLRRSLKEHEFYYVAPDADADADTDADAETSLSSSGTEGLHSTPIPVVQDATHTLQRSFVHWVETQERLRGVPCQEETNNADEDSDSGGSVDEEVTSPKILLNGSQTDTDVESQEPSVISNASAIVETNVTHTNTSGLDLDCEDGGNPDEISSTLVPDSESKDKWTTYWFGNRWSGPVQDVQDHQSDGGNDNDEHVDKNVSNSDSEKEQSSDSDVAEDYTPSWWSTMLNSGQSTRIDDGNRNNFQRPDSRFFWNEECVSPLLRTVGAEAEDHSGLSPCHILLDYTIPVTSAFVGIQRNIALAPNAITGASFSVTYDEILISRRSKYRAGTRFTKRGADGIGDVANFAETEQICVVRNGTDDIEAPSVQEIYSHVQTRGSIPLRWSSPTDIKTYRPKVMIGTNPLAQARALRNHLVEQLSLYSSFAESGGDDNANLVFLNLIDKHSDQGRLGRTFDEVLNAVLTTYEDEQGVDDHIIPGLLNPNSVSHVWFDFHSECRKGRWDRLSYLLDDVRPCLDSHGYFCVIPDQKSLWEVLWLQNGVVRTNCMDCLDRTNVVQSMFGRYILFQQFSDRFGLKATTKRKLPLGYNVAFKRKMLTLPWLSGEVAHRLLWADNADSISRLYAGTNALKGDFTRTGKRTKRGALDDGVNSLTRFYLNNFLDADRQEGMDLLTGYAKFDTVERPDKLQHKYSGSTRSGRISKRRFRDFFQREKLDAVTVGSRLSLSWLPGDLQSHLRSASISSMSLKNEDMILVKSSSDVSLSLALRDIDRRAMLDEPWWVTENDGENSEKKATRTPQQVATLRSSSSGHVMAALIASLKAPITTAMAYICFMIPGLLIDR